MTGNKLKADSAPGLDYRSYLAAPPEGACSTACPGPSRTWCESYRNALAGFAVKLTAEQAKRIEKDAGRRPRLEGRRCCSRSRPRAIRTRASAASTATAPSYLRLTDQTAGLWKTARRSRQPQRRGRRRDRRRHRHRHPARAPELRRPRQRVTSARATTRRPSGTAPARRATGFAISDCNNKLIGARYYVDGFGRNNLDPTSHLSPRDDEGHGTHTASTAAGNYGVDPVIEGNDLGVDVISGISPRSYVAAYKVCWEGNGVTAPAGCSTADSVKAIDDAVADGVDVINYSVGSTTSQILGADGYAYLGASDAGVFVANSAGNSGPGAGTVGSPASVPWLTTVGASTLARAFISTVTVKGASETFTIKGASVTNALPDTPLVDSASAGLRRCSGGRRRALQGRHARPGEGHRQGRALPARRQRAHRQEPAGQERRRRGDDPLQRRPTRRTWTPTRTGCRPRT